MSYRLRNILIAAVLAAVAALLTTYYVTNVRRDAQKGEDLVSVFVAVRDIVAGTPGSEVLEGDLLKSKEVARRSVVPGAISNPRQVEELVATETIYAGEQVTVRRFQPVAQQGIVGQLSGNMRALQVPGDQHQLLAGTVRDGDRVDLVASIKFRVADVVPTDLTDAGDRAVTEVERTATRIVLRDLLVLRAAEEPALDGRLAAATSANASVVLAVTDSQAQKLFFVMKNAEWSLQLRPVNDAADSPESVETVESVLGDGLKTAQLEQLLSGLKKRSTP